ncbi:protein SUPPRESSOR OF GENE SILENCING 3-like [Herrania umbratica]|uniref:Protein SUPPRESSOR OF GENE SILENCING 3-like n=1 Tax=Herrania umbratica TaxID=108875 RepID=A0A6J1B4S0_9ROSI|nr:protein SUPPRESSOR OF GENE SILENCING 3-like [Herrania umbratica]
MGKEFAFDLIYGVGNANENEILELSYATFAEELQLQEILKESMIASEITTNELSSLSSPLPLPSAISTPQAISSPSSEQSLEELEMEELERAFNFKIVKDQEDAAAEAFNKSACPVCHRLSFTECNIPQGSGLNCHEKHWIDWDEIGRGQAESSGLSCNEQRRINWDEKGRKHSMAWSPRWSRPTGRYQPKFKGRRKGDIPQITSSNEFHAKTSSRFENVLIAGIGNNQDPKGKGKAIDDDWLLVSKKKPKSRAGSGTANRWDPLHPNPLKVSEDNNKRVVKVNEVQNIVPEDDYDASDDEDDFDSDTSQKSHESRKKGKTFKEFFERIDALNIEEIDETVWHCPACQGGPGAIKWYRSIQDLIAHAKNIGTRRVKRHRELAELLEEELRRKGTSIAPAGQIVLGNWKGLKEDARDHDIVWPPMVVIVNTMTNIYKDGKCVGMGRLELLEHFSSYPALKAEHSYGPQGHRGLSVLIFESSAVGYLEAERLHTNFVEQGLDRSAWNSCSDVILPGGGRQLYGFMAVKEDLDIFNEHCQGKSKIKYELKSYQMAVLNEIKKMSEDSQQLIWLKDRLAEERKRAKTFEQSVQNLSRNLQQKTRDIHIFKQRVQSLHEQNKEEMGCQENFYKDQIKILEAGVKELEKLQASDANPLHREEPEPAVACPMEEYTPYQHNSNHDIDEDRRARSSRQNLMKVGMWE